MEDDLSEGFCVDIYFDCVERTDEEIEMMPMYESWISEIRLSAYRKYGPVGVF